MYVLDPMGAATSIREFNAKYPIGGLVIYYADAHVMLVLEKGNARRAKILGEAFVSGHNIKVQIDLMLDAVLIDEIRELPEFLCYSCNKTTYIRSRKYSGSELGALGKAIVPDGLWGDAYCEHCNRPVWEYIAKRDGKISNIKVSAKICKKPKPKPKRRAKARTRK